MTIETESMFTAIKIFITIVQLAALVGALDPLQEPTECHCPTRIKLVKDDQVHLTFQGNHTESRKSDIAVDNVGRLTIDSYQNSPYIGELTVGTPGKKFRVLFDTNSCYLWIPSADCRSANCQNRTTYDPSQSETYLADGKQLRVPFFASTKLEGLTSRDKVSIGGLSIQEQTFVEILNMEGEIFSSLKYDGVFGLALQDLHDNHIITLMQNLNVQKLIPQPIISFYINENANKPEECGEVTLGAMNENFYEGEIHWVPLFRAHLWQFRIDRVALKYQNGTEIVEVCQGGCNGVLETGTGAIGGTSTDISTLTEGLGAVELYKGVALVEDCDIRSLPDLVFTLAGKEFVLSGNKYTRPLFVKGARKPNCQLLLRSMASRSHTQWLLGGAFLRNYYVILDYRKKRFGLATLAH